MFRVSCKTYSQKMVIKCTSCAMLSNKIFISFLYSMNMASSSPYKVNKKKLILMVYYQLEIRGKSLSIEGTWTNISSSKSANKPSSLSGGSLSQFQQHEATRNFPLHPGWDVSPSQGYPQQIAGNTYTWVERDTVAVSAVGLVSKNTKQCSWPEFHLRLLNLEVGALTMRPLNWSHTLLLRQKKTCGK